MTELEANEWDLANRKRFILALTAVVTAFMAVLWAFHGTRAVVESRYLYVAFYLPGVVACLLLCCWLTTVLRFRSPRRGPTTVGVKQVDEGIVFRPSVKLRFGAGLAVVLATVGSLVFAVGMWTDALAFPMLPWQRDAFPVIGALFATKMIVTMVMYLTGRQRFPEIQCTPAYVRINGKRARQVVGWDQIATIDPIVRAPNWYIGMTLAVGERADVTI